MKTPGFATTLCPRCGDDDCITTTLHDLHSFSCDECNANFTADEVRGLIACWTPILAWLDAAPTYES